MERKPKNTKETMGRSKGFYIAIYSTLGAALILAVAIGYYNFIVDSGPTGEFSMTFTPPGAEQGQTLDLGSIWDIDSVPVGAMDWPALFGDDGVAAHGNRPATTPAPAPNRPAATTPDQPAVTTAQAQASPAPTAPPAASDQDLDDARRQPAATPAPAPEHEEEAGCRPEEAPPQAPTDNQDDGAWYDTSGDNDIPTQEADRPAEPVFEQAIAPIVPTFPAFVEGSVMSWPVLGDVVMDFSMDALIFDVTLNQWRVNDSISIATERGAQVRAAASGVVTDVTNTRQFGQTVVIDHGNGWVTTYSQLENNVAVGVGDVVQVGQIIGTVGQPSIFASLLGYHVAFGISNNNSPINPNLILAER